MKAIKSFIVLLTITFILPIFVKAFTSLEISTPNPVKDDYFYIQLDINYNSSNRNLKIHDFNVYIEYDREYFEFISVSWLQGENDYEHKLMDEQTGRIYISKRTNKDDWPLQIAPVQIKFKALKTGLSEIKVKRNGESHYNDGSIIAQSLSNVTANVVLPSTNTIIRTLEVEGYTLEPTFSRERKDYKLTVPANVTNIKIIATPSDKRQTIEGTGKFPLDYGLNNFTVRVKAQNGDYSDYTIAITRKDDRTGDTSLKSLSVSDTNIRYEQGVTTYEATVSKSVDSVLIVARTNDPKASLEGTGRRSLSIGKNTFQLTVKSTKNTQTIYTINITRSTEELAKIVRSSKLKTLRANGLSLDVSKSNRTYPISVKNNGLTIDAVGESETTKISISGDKDLKPGINLVTVKVTEIMEEATETKEAVTEETIYKILVYHFPSDATIVDNIKKIEVSNNPLFITTEGANEVIPANSMSYLERNNKSLYYNVVNIYGGIVYQAKIGKNITDKELNASFKEKEKGSLTYHTELPEGTGILLYLGDYYEDGTSVRIYSFNDGEKYKLLTDGITVTNGYIEFELNGDTNFTVTTAQLVKEKGPIEKFFEKNGIFIGSILGVIVIVILYVTILNKYKDRKASKDMAY